MLSHEFRCIRSLVKYYLFHTVKSIVEFASFASHLQFAINVNYAAHSSRIYRAWQTGANHEVKPFVAARQPPPFAVIMLVNRKPALKSNAQLGILLYAHLKVTRLQCARVQPATSAL